MPAKPGQKPRPESPSINQPSEDTIKRAPATVGGPPMQAANLTGPAPVIATGTSSPCVRAKRVGSLLGVQQRRVRSAGLPTRKKPRSGIVSGTDGTRHDHGDTSAVANSTDRAMFPPSATGAAAVNLYWLPLGAGGHCVRLNGRVFEFVSARLQHRSQCDLYHSALEIQLGSARYVIEMAPVWNERSKERGVVAEGSVGMRAARRLRLFRYEVRRSYPRRR